MAMIDRENSEASDGAGAKRRAVKLFGKTWHLPQSRWLRIAIGFTLVVFGILGFLPVLGFWMIPLGFLVLSFELALFRRMRRRFLVRNNKRAKKRR